MSLRLPKLAFFTFFLAGALSLIARNASAELIIEQPGAHPDYKLEIEPHLTFPLDFDGVGLGVRLSAPVVHNGFVNTINNNVAISFGLDWVHYDGCYRGWGWRRHDWCGGSVNFFQIPVALQWNFFLATHWSLYAELGLSLQRLAYSGDWEHHGYRNPSRTRVRFAGFLGARYHFNESVALTLRLGEVSSLGVSFW